MSMRDVICGKEKDFPFGSINNKSIALKSVDIKGDINGLFFDYTISQEYHNDSGKALEIIYTFPVSWNTCLLGLTAKIGDKELTGYVVEKNEAEEKYEEAIDKGDSAIMLQKTDDGLYSVNLGNIKKDENVTVSIHCAKLLDFSQGQVRLAIPTVISERYGNQYDVLAPHESAKTDPAACYPLSISLTLHGDIAKGSVSCPTHPVKLDKDGDQLEVTLGAGAALDRDFVLIMDGLQSKSHVQYAHDKDGYMLAASFYPEFTEDSVSPIALKILVDCSGSMSGQRIAEAKKGLNKTLEELGNGDYVSYSRFGNDVKHMTNNMLPCSDATLLRLKKNVAATDADMGGTEMEDALTSTFRDVAPVPGDELPSIVLLITDGDVWAVKKIITAAKKSGHRVFTIGVGCSPAEKLLIEMAEQTGGACELVTPGENIADAIVRMFRRMRSAIATHIAVNWNCATEWQSLAPRFIFPGETVHCFAAVKSLAAEGPTLNWTLNGKEYACAAAKPEECASKDLARLGIMTRINESEDKKENQKLALEYQLVTDETSLILINERDESEKTKGLPTVQQVPQMAAAGHGCYGKPGILGAVSSFAAHFAADKYEVPCFLRKWGDEFQTIKYDASPESFNIYSDADDLVSSCEDKTKAELLEQFLNLWNKTLYGGNFTLLVDGHAELKLLLDFIYKTGLDNGVEPDAAIAVFIEWAFAQLKKEGRKAGAPNRHERRWLKDALKDVPALQMNILETEFQDWYDHE